MELIARNIIYRHLSIAFALVVLCAQIAYGKWQGPETVVEVPFGNGELQVGITNGDVDIFDAFPRLLAFDEKDNIFIGDDINKKVLYFDNSGELKGVIYPKIDFNDYDWPIDMVALGDDKLIVVSGEDYQIYSYNGNMIKNINIGDNTALWGTIYTENFVIAKGDYFFKFDINGELVERSLEYKDPCEINKSDEYESCTSTLSEEFFGVATSYVEKFSPCKILISKLEMPDDLVFKGDVDQSGEQYFLHHDRYGKPYVAPSGNVFTWLVTPNDYKIVKWTWVDSPDDPKGGPDAPVNLTVQPSIDGLYLAWGASPQDPGCVDGYEVERSTSADGIYTIVTTTGAGVLKYNDTGALPGTTYYYKVRAKSGSEYSDYTAEVSGKRL